VGIRQRSFCGSQLCRALDTAKNKERAIQQMDAQALLDLCTSLEAKDDVDHGREV